MEGRLLKLNEVAQVTGLAVRTLQLYIKQGKLRAFKPGGANRIGWRCTENAVIDMVREQVPEEYRQMAEAEARRRLRALPDPS